MSYVSRGAVTGAVYGAASALIVPSFCGVVGRFLMYNVIEFVILFILSGTYGGLTGREALNQRLAAAAPTEAQLVVTNPQVVMSDGMATQMMDLTFTNRSRAALENVRFWCGWKETRLNQYEDPITSDESITTLWVLGRFEPGTANRLRVGVTGRFNRDSRPSKCKVIYDDFDLSQSLRRN